MAAPSEARTDRAIHVLPWVSLAVLFAVFITTIWVVANSLQTNEGLDAQGRSDDITACRSLYRADIDTAQGVKDDAESRRLDAISDIILSARSDDRSRLAKAVADLNESKLAVAVARDGVDKANAAYRFRTQQSRSHPSAFLAACRKHS